MKDRGKRLTRNQKIMLAAKGYDPKEYLLLSDMENTILLKERKSDKQVLVDKPVGKRR